LGKTAQYMKNVAWRTWRTNAYARSATRIKSRQPLGILPRSCRVPHDTLDLTFRHIFAPHASDVLPHYSAVHAFCVSPEDYQHFQQQRRRRATSIGNTGWRRELHGFGWRESPPSLHAVIVTFFNSNSSFCRVLKLA